MNHVRARSVQAARDKPMRRKSNATNAVIVVVCHVHAAFAGHDLCAKRAVEDSTQTRSVLHLPFFTAGDALAVAGGWIHTVHTSVVARRDNQHTGGSACNAGRIDERRQLQGTQLS